jgi:hypothetical protein
LKLSRLAKGSSVFVTKSRIVSPSGTSKVNGVAKKRSTASLASATGRVTQALCVAISYSTKP